MAFIIEPDTIKLLRECDAGVKMGISSSGDILDSMQADDLRQCLKTCMSEHEKPEHEITHLLNDYHDAGKEPNPMAKGMSWIKTNVTLAAGEPDPAVANLITDGCNMGVKSLNRYLNQYKAADEQSKDIAKRLSRLEEDLEEDLRPYL